MSENKDLLDLSITTNSNYGNQKSLPNATATLVLGICSLATCWVYGVPGLICGIIALSLHQKDKRTFQTNPKAYEVSFKTAKAGFICAIIGTSISALWFLLFGVAIIGTLLGR